MRCCGHNAPHSPGDAMTLLVDPERVRFACDPFENPSWKRASQLTKGSDDLLVADAFADRRAVQQYAERLQRLCEGGFEEFAAAVTAEPLRIASIPKLDPWDVDQELWQEVDSFGRESRAHPVPTRDIAVRTVFGRCLSAHMASVLTDCADHLLPGVAAAYRPGRSDAVQQAILDAADAVARGHRFWIKVDVADAFNSLPRRRVGEELKVLGFDDAFVARVLAVVGAPRVRRIRGRWVPVPNDRGCPAGLPESAVLINVLFRRFDLDVARRHPNVVYIRYSDDLLFLAATRAEAEAVAAMLLRWTREAGLALKGVSPNQCGRTLVHEIDRDPLAFLGAEIGPDGDIHIPREALDTQIRKLQYRLELAHREGHMVAVHSRYAVGGRAEDAISTFDGEDVQRSALQFFWYWHRLNSAEAKGFLARVGSELGFEPTSTTGPRRKVWATTLGGSDDTVGGGRADRVMIRESFTEWVRDAVISHIEDALRDERNHLKDTSDHGTESIPFAGDGGPSMGHRDREEESMADDSSWPTPGEEVPHGGSHMVDDVYEPGSRVRNRGFARGPCGDASDGADASGPTTPEGAVPPSPPVLQDLGLLFLSHRVVRTMCGEVVVIATDLCLPGRSHDARVLRYRPQGAGDSVPVEIVVLEHLGLCLRQAAAGGRIAVAMESAWLVKLLIQRGREIRSTSLFQRVRALHAEHPDLVVIGACRLPRRAARLLERETGLVRQEELRNDLRRPAL